MRKILCLLLTLVCAMLCLNGCGNGAASGDDPLLIRSFVIGSSVGEVETVREGGETRYVIHITLPEDTDFKRCVANIELAQGASLDMSSPCIVDDLGGRPVLNLTLENRTLVVEHDGESRIYAFKIDLQ